MPTAEEAPIVVGVDGSPASRRAVQWAVDEATRRQLPVELVCAWHTDYGAETIGPLVPSIEEDCRSIVESAAAEVRAGSPALDVSTHVVQEQAAFALITASTRADTVVVGSRGLGAVKEALLGSTSLQLVAHARCPVVVVREVGEPDADAPVVVGADGSSLSADATGYAFAQAARRGRAVTVLHAWDPRLYSSGLGMGTIVETWNDLEATQQDIVASAVAPWVEAYPDVEVRTHVLPGRPGEVLVDASAHAELVVVGSRGRGGFRGLLLGSVSRNVLLRAHCPVAVVRPQRREGAKD